jgi:hypothetical protein
MNFLANLGPILRKASWVGLGITAVLVLVLSVYLAISAQRADPAPDVKVASATTRPGPAGRKPVTPAVRPRGDREAAEVAPPSVKPPVMAPDLALKPPIKPLATSAVVPPLPAVSDPPKGPEPMAAGALSKDDLEKRRTDRRERQSDRLRTRVKTLEERIESYKKDGSRTTTQVERMQQSLDRLKERLKRMEEEEKAGGGGP